MIAAGWALARFRIIDGGEGRLILNRTAFFAATPALMFTVVAESRPEELFSPVIVLTVIATAVTAAVGVLGCFLVYPKGSRDPAVVAMTSAASSYVNSNNIGLPVSLYVIGTGAYVPPVLVLQMVVMTPVLLAVLSASGASARGGGQKSPVRAALGALASPIVLGALGGTVVCLTHTTVPDPVMEPLRILGGASIPMILISFGASLTQTQVLRSATDRPGTLVATGLKTVVMPLVAWAMAGACGLRGDELYAVVILAALPTAQNVYNYAATYQRATIVARDTVFLTTFAALPVMLAIALLFGR